MIKDTNIASYEPSSFCISADVLLWNNLSVNLSQIDRKDYSSFMHEWWHYIQDITTVSSQNGFYLLLRDIAKLTAITCKKEGEVIQLPLSEDEYGHPVGKYRRLYNIECGEKIEVQIPNARISKVESYIEEIELDGVVHPRLNCIIEINGIQYEFRKIVLEELNAFYVQRIVESHISDCNRLTRDLPEFPYHVGDLLFDYYQITATDKAKLAISYLSLDSLQAVAVFVKCLQSLKGKNIDYPRDRDIILNTVDHCTRQCAHSNDEALGEWLKDYENWANKQDGHAKFKEALNWYLTQMYQIYQVKGLYGRDILVKVICSEPNHIELLYKTFPPPLIKIHDEILSSAMLTDKKEEEAIYNNALVLWFTKRVYDVLCCDSISKASDLAKCKLFPSCKYKEEFGKEMVCAMDSWNVVQGENTAICPYAIALHNMGLWQNRVEFDID